MEAFFLSIVSLLALLVIATAICVMLRFGITQRVVSSYQGIDHLAQPRSHLLGGTLALGLIVVFSLTLLLAVMSR
jgi:hypothetical protein